MINPWLLAALALMAIPTVRVEIRLSRMRAGAMWQMHQAGRRQFFYANLLSSPREAKEIRLYGLGEYFRERMLDEQRSANRADRRVDQPSCAYRCFSDCSALWWPAPVWSGRCSPPRPGG